MKKKFAMMIMNPLFDPEQDTARLDHAGAENHILTVRTPEEAVEKARTLADEGFGAIEVCGAFGEALARRMYDAADHRLTVSYVVTPPDQLKDVLGFWHGDLAE